MPENTPRPVVAVAGTVGKAPQTKNTSKGPVVNFSIAVKTSYEEGAADTWYDVSVWNEGLQVSVMKELYKGAKVAVEGTYSVRPYEGREYPQISGARVGLVDYLSRTPRADGAPVPAQVAAQVAAPAPAPTPVADRDADDLPF